MAVPRWDWRRVPAAEPLPAPTVLGGSEWRARADAHAAAVDRLTAHRRQRRATGRRHPVEDFLFDYYGIRAGRLRRWHPGAGVVLMEAEPFADLPGYVAVDIDGRRGYTVDPGCFADCGDLARRGDAARRAVAVMAGTAARPPRWTCFGMHEWAMVLGLEQKEIRHSGWPLRPDADTIASTVSQLGLRCTHFDAFRFFTDSAAPRNWRELTPADQLTVEQPACLHAGMDLYRWAVTLQPLTSSDLVLRCLHHAFAAREVDMRASPYDLRALGYAPIAMEHPEGRAEYARLQRELHASAARLRAEILAVAAEAQMA